MASCEPKDSSLVHFISLRSFCVLVLAPSTTCSISNHVGLGALGTACADSWVGKARGGNGHRHCRHCLTLRERKTTSGGKRPGMRVVKCVCGGVAGG